MKSAATSIACPKLPVALAAASPRSHCFLFLTLLAVKGSQRQPQRRLSRPTSHSSPPDILQGDRFDIIIVRHVRIDSLRIYLRHREEGAIVVRVLARSLLVRRDRLLGVVQICVLVAELQPRVVAVGSTGGTREVEDGFLVVAEKTPVASLEKREDRRDGVQSSQPVDEREKTVRVAERIESVAGESEEEIGVGGSVRNGEVRRR